MPDRRSTEPTSGSASDQPPDGPSPDAGAEPSPRVTKARPRTAGAATASATRAKRSSAKPPTSAKVPASPTAAETAAPSGTDGGSTTRTQAARIAGDIVPFEVQRGAIGRAEATDIAVSQGAIGFARGDRVSLEMGAVGLVVGREATVSQGLARMVLARDVRFAQSAIGTVAAATSTFERPSLVGIVLARQVRGDVRVLLDWRGALAAGAVLGLLLGLLRRR